MNDLATSSWKSIEPSDVPMRTLYQYLVGVVAPRPIAFVSSINRKGEVNLSPFSFFNVFSIDPPILVFSPTRKGRDLSKKDTRINVEEVPEVVIHMVDAEMAEQMSITSAEYPYGIDEFDKGGFEACKSDLVRVPRIGKALVAMECHVDKIMELGEIAGSGCLIICRLLKMHVKSDLLDEYGRLDLTSLYQLGRMGANLYCNASGSSLFEMSRPSGIGMGIDRLPPKIRLSKFLTGNELGKLGKLLEFPSELMLKKVQEKEDVSRTLSIVEKFPETREESICLLARRFLNSGDSVSAISVLFLL